MVRRRCMQCGPIDLIGPYRKVDMAISVRRLSWRYNGPCWTVRRASDNATIDVGFDPLTDLVNRSVIAAFCSGTTGSLAQWWDQSGNGVHCTQGTAASQPLVFTSGDLYRDAYGLPRVYHSTTGMILNFDATKVANGSTTSTCLSKTRNETAVGVRSRYSWGTNSANSYRSFETDNGNLPRVNNGTTSVAVTTSDLNTDIIAAARFSIGSNPNMTLRVQYDNASNTVNSVTANPTTWTTGTTFGKIWGRPADTTSVVGYSQEYIFVNGNLISTGGGIQERIMANLVEYYGFNR